MIYAYKIENLKNGFVYIGVTADPEGRWCNHKSKSAQSDNTELYSAMKQFGNENFRFQIIAQSKDEHDRWPLEIALIAQYDSYNCGYNMTKGGSDASHLKSTAPARVVLTGEHLGQVSLSDPRWELHEIESIWKGRPVSQSTRDKLAAKRVGTVSGSDNFHAKRFKLTSPSGEIYESFGTLSLLAKELMLSYSTLNNHINTGTVVPPPHKCQPNATAERKNTTGWRIDRIVT